MSFYDPVGFKAPEQTAIEALDDIDPSSLIYNVGFWLVIVFWLICITFGCVGCSIDGKHLHGDLFYEMLFTSTRPLKIEAKNIMKAVSMFTDASVTPTGETENTTNNPSPSKAK